MGASGRSSDTPPEASEHHSCLQSCLAGAMHSRPFSGIAALVELEPDLHDRIGPSARRLSMSESVAVGHPTKMSANYYNTRASLHLEHLKVAEYPP